MSDLADLRATGTIIAGRYDTFAEAEATRSRLEASGFPRSSISVFFNNPPGRHDLTEIGGDETADPQATHASEGALAGAAVGAGLGLAAIAAGPLGVAAAAGAGAYLGALTGAINATDSANPARPLRRPSGVMVAIHVGASGRDADAIRVLESTGADGIERAAGTWRDGDWADFDPVAVPQFVRADLADFRS
jgi:hypothetical protein